ncbi:hypothetical protein JCM10212_005522 [Sporobolomyces blumeae]
MPPKPRSTVPPDQDLRARGNKAYQSNQPQLAVDLYSQAILKDWNSADREHVAALYSNRAAAWCQLKQFNLAYCDVKAVLKIRPNWSRGWERRATIHRGLYLFKLAKLDYEKAASLSSDVPNRNRLNDLARLMTWATIPTASKLEPVNLGNLYSDVTKQGKDWLSMADPVRLASNSWTALETAYRGFYDGSKPPAAAGVATRALLSALRTLELNPYAAHLDLAGLSAKHVKQRIADAKIVDGVLPLDAELPSSLVHLITILIQNSGTNMPRAALSFIDASYVYYGLECFPCPQTSTVEDHFTVVNNVSLVLVTLSQLKSSLGGLDLEKLSWFGPGWRKALTKRMLLSMLYLAELDELAPEEAEQMHRTAVSVFDVLVEDAAAGKTPKCETQRYALETRPLAWSLLGQAFALRIKSQRPEHIQASQPGVIWPNLKMIRTAGQLAKRAIALLPPEEPDKVRAMNCALVCDFWMGGMTIEEAFERVAEIERTKAFSEEYFGPADNVYPDADRIRSFCRLIHRNLDLVAGNPFTAMPEPCWSNPRERKWLIVKHVLKPCGLVESAGRTYDNKVVMRRDVEYHMGQEVNGDLEMWDAYKKWP